VGIEEDGLVEDDEGLLFSEEHPTKTTIIKAKMIRLVFFILISSLYITHHLDFVINN
jgi:hypothetical protein